MATHVEGRLLRRSIPYLEAWISELAAPAAAAVAPAAAAGKPAKQQQQTRGGKAAAAAEGPEPTAMSRCCFAVGRVVEVARHPESDKLYIEKIDMGAELNALTGDAPRVILSGLQEFVTEAEFLNRLVLVIANLEPRKIAGVPSNGMVLCASSSSGEGDAAVRRVVLVDVPAGATVGERVVFAGHDMPHEPVLKKKLAKNFEEVIAEVATNAEGQVCWRGLPFTTSAGALTATIPNAPIS